VTTPDDAPRPRRRALEDSLLRGGVRGIALVTLATLGLAAVAAVIALVVSLLY
jgi:hypothetical protein